MKEKKINEIKKRNYKKFWLDLWLILEELRGKFKVILVFIIVCEFLNLLGPYFLKLIIDRLTIFRKEDIAIILFLVLILFLSDQFNSLLNTFKDKRLLKFLIDAENITLKKAQKKLIFLSLSYHETENTGNKIIKVERGVSKIGELIGNLSWEVIPTMIQLALTLIILFVVDYRFGLIFLSFAPIFIFLTLRVNIKLRPSRKQRYKQYEKASGLLGQSIININTVKSFVQEKKEIVNYGIIMDDVCEKETTEWMYLFNFNMIRNLTVISGNAIIILIGVYLVSSSLITIGTLVFVITLSQKSFSSMYRLSRFYDKIEEGAEAVERLIKLLEEEQVIKSPVSGITPKKIEGVIAFEDLSFSYQGDNILALKNINLTIPASSVTALIGPSGGGKTTLARMIYRHYDPQKGLVKLDGNNLIDYDLYGFRKFIAIVPQEVEIFNLSIKDNIAYAKPDSSMKEVMAAAKIANAHEFIEKLSDKYNTEVGERGVKLSGGQRQRIGIARAILVNPKILIFDEATSNLDSYSEKLIQEAMERISKGRTTILIAHRLSTIKKADKIVVLENGEIVEQGSHAELSRVDGGLYAKLLKLQELGDID